ncbi:hypothetical protein PTI45_04688 [Paenibacillus nuruki]|uniref:Immunity protein 30 domain-containing protein n=1 Tax=Paenibacillus nuruki TaxID=1886670 RepID=A0A1E3KWN6_9BACL|nr:hypothetical protein [Paenibacillus nuruki]ODP25957.1 hypothetical protein PTI45_04688 [Paenibacillus nuruki]
MLRNDRDRIVAGIKHLCDGLSPFQKMDSVEDFIKMHTDVYDTFGDDSFDILIDILLHPPELGRIDPNDFEYELQEALSAVGRRNPRYALDTIEDLLGIKSIRLVLINVIGGLKNENGLFLLESLLQPSAESDLLAEDELIGVACAVDEIRGEKAVELLAKMKIRYRNHSSDLLEYIEDGLNGY